MSKKKGEHLQLQIDVTNDDDWQELLQKPGLWVIDVFRTWSGPCICAQNALKKIKLELNDEMLNYAAAACDNIQALEAFRFTCEPQWLFVAGGEMVGIMKGADVSQLTKMILTELDKEKKVLAGGLTRNLIPDLFEILKPTKLDFGNPAEEEEEKDLSLKMFRAIAKVHFTAKALTTRQHTLALIKPDAVANGNLPEILQILREHKIEVLYQQERILTAEEVSGLYPALVDEPFFSTLVTYMTGGPSVVLILTRRPEDEGSIITDWQELLGPSDVSKAKLEYPDSLRAVFGTDGFSNALHGSIDERRAEEELNFFFPNLYGEMHRHKSVAGEEDLQYCIIVVRPATFKKFPKEDIVNALQQEGLQVIAKQRINFNADLAEQLCPHLRRPELEPVVQASIGGPSLALVVACDDVIKKVATALGPENVKDARAKAPNSIRAKHTPHDQAVTGFYASHTPDDARRDLTLIFPLLADDFSKVQRQQLDKVLRDKVKSNVPMQFAIILVMPHTLKKYKNRTLMKYIYDTRMYVYADKIITLTRDMAGEFFADYLDDPEYNTLIESAVSGPSLILCVIAEEILSLVKETLGPISVVDAKKFTPTSLRSLFSDAKDEVSPMYCSESEIQATIQLKLFYPEIFEQVMNIIKGNVPKYAVAIISPSIIASFSRDKIEAAFVKDLPPFIFEKSIILSESQAEELYADHKSKDIYAATVKDAITEEVLIIAIRAISAISKLKESIATGALSSIKSVAGDVIAIRPTDNEKAAVEEMNAIFPYEVTFGIIKPDAVAENNADKIKQIIVDYGLHIVSESLVDLTPEQVSEFYKEKQEAPFFSDLVKYMCSGKVLLLVIRGHSAVTAFKRLIGPTDPELAKKDMPFTIRALFGKTILANAIHGSSGAEEAKMKMEISMQGSDLVHPTLPEFEEQIEKTEQVYSLHNISFFIQNPCRLFSYNLEKHVGLFDCLKRKDTNKKCSKSLDLFYNCTPSRKFRLFLKRPELYQIVAPVQVFLDKHKEKSTRNRERHEQAVSHNTLKLNTSKSTSSENKQCNSMTKTTEESKLNTSQSKSEEKRFAAPTKVPQLRISKRQSSDKFDHLFPPFPFQNKGRFRSFPEEYHEKKKRTATRPTSKNALFSNLENFSKSQTTFLKSIMGFPVRQTSSTKIRTNEKQVKNSNSTSYIMKLKDEKQKLTKSLHQNISELEKIEHEARQLKCKLLAFSPKCASDSRLIAGKSNSRNLASSFLSHLHPKMDDADRSFTNVAKFLKEKSWQKSATPEDPSCPEKQPDGCEHNYAELLTSPSTTCLTVTSFPSESDDLDSQEDSTTPRTSVNNFVVDKLQGEILQVVHLIQQQKACGSDMGKREIAKMQNELIESMFAVFMEANIGVGTPVLMKLISDVISKVDKELVISASVSDVGTSASSSTAMVEKEMTKETVNMEDLVSSCLIETEQAANEEMCAMEWSSADGIASAEKKISDTFIDQICSGSIDYILIEVVKYYKKIFQ